MNEQLEKARKWKKIANVVWYACVGLILLVAGIWERWVPEVPPVVANLIFVFLGLVFLMVAFVEGRHDALASVLISQEQYSERKTVAVRMTMFFGGLLGLLGCGTVIAVLKDGEVSAWVLPGIIFLFVAFCINRELFEIFFLKRLGKVGTNNPNQVEG
ncbi:hypothetical protein A2482_01130 [Candidatus Falkowbacteria bacterium RIFOXYC2_FULL_48_21]|uniref:Uncharacterized protein n=1 Tax=Candidatus Falkowbacteria bacterium RIFOXYC2_FULL_48_21 TaxID=1798005 RepID=A0A1F5T7Y1_9BACT|nr:MAG: hypothetical protein A2482_01130 [Candidatus Falkowbacteria bacterium RIFOXYC2_FULL_48_21]